MLRPPNVSSSKRCTPQLVQFLKRVRPKVLIKGADYRADQVIGREVVEADGGEVILVDLVPGHSTSDIVERSRAPVKA